MVPVEGGDDQLHVLALLDGDHVGAEFVSLGRDLDLRALAASGRSRLLSGHRRAGDCE